MASESGCIITDTLFSNPPLCCVLSFSVHAMRCNAMQLPERWAALTEAYTSEMNAKGDAAASKLSKAVTAARKKAAKEARHFGGYVPHRSIMLSYNMLE